jgi:Uma2 family endonuclease
MLTLRDYRRFPDDGRRHEILAGVHVVSPRPVPYHQLVAMRLCAWFDRTITRTGLGIALPDVTVELAEHDVVDPDITVLLQPYADRLLRTRVRGVPDLIVEVLSPGNRSHDRRHKKDRYAFHGVREYWLVDPVARSCEQWRRRGNGWSRLGAHYDRVRLAVLPAVEVDLQAIW